MPGTIQVVIDTNVLIASLQSKQGASYVLVNDLVNNKWKANISVPLLWEYEEIAHREKQQLGLNGVEIEDLLKSIVENSRHIEISFKWPLSADDPDDEMIVELAIAAGANYLVTFNKRNFTEARRFGIQVVTPGEFLAILRS